MLLSCLSYFSAEDAENAKKILGGGFGAGCHYALTALVF